MDGLAARCLWGHGVDHVDPERNIVISDDHLNFGAAISSSRFVLTRVYVPELRCLRHSACFLVWLLWEFCSRVILCLANALTGTFCRILYFFKKNVQYSVR
jgi:hypothetical protein